MPPVGRPRSTTDAGVRAPTSEIGVPYVYNNGFSTGIAGQPLFSGSGPWRMFIDEWEYNPELQWPYSVPLFNQMRTDEQLAGLLTAVMWGISQLRFVIDPNGCPPDQVDTVCKSLNLPEMGKEDQQRGRLKARFSHSKHINNAMLAAIYGHMYFEQVGTIVDGKWQLRKLAPRLPQTIRNINVADDGGLVSIQQWGPANSQTLDWPEIPVDRLVGYVFQQEGYNWVGRSMLRDVYRSWLLKDRLLRIEAINHERAGGVPYANAPQGATVDEVEDLDIMMRNFRIGEMSGGALPYGAELNIAKGTGSDVDRTIKRLDEGMARKFLLMLVNLAQGGQHVGSYALGQTFEDFFIVGQRQIAQWYCDTTTEHVIEDMMEWNYGEDIEATPFITWERSSEDALGTEQLALLVERGVITMDDETEQWVRYRNRLPKKTEPRPVLEVTPAGPRQPTEQQSLGERPGGQTGVQPDQAGGTGGQTAKPSTTAASGERVLPPSSDVAASSGWRFRFWRKPDVMASAAEYEWFPDVSNVRGVPVMEAGVEYRLSTGPTTFTPQDLADVAAAINEDFSLPKPRLGIGHIDPRWNDDEELQRIMDGEPSWGTLANARLDDNGMVLYADYEGVPTWLAKLLPFAFPSRSIEGSWNIQSDAGRNYRFVLSACKVLGIQWPGINKLQDLPSYFGKEVPADVVVEPQIIAAAYAAANLSGGDPMKFPWSRETAASANLDDVRREFYQVFATADQSRKDWWIRQVLVDPNEVVVQDEQSGQLYRLSYASAADGKVSFGEPEKVRVGLIPENKPELLPAAASATAELLATGREVLASWSDPTESRRDSNPQGGAVDPIQIRTALGLAADASDVDVQTALLARAGITAEQPATPAPAPAPSPTPAPEQQPAPTQPATPETPPAPAEPAQPAQPATGNVVPFPGLPDNVVVVDKGTLETLQQVAASAGELVTSTRKKERENLVMAAIGDGRIPSASKDGWLALFEKDPNAAQTLASLAPGLIPVSERGHSHAPDVQATVQLENEQIAGWSSELFPEVVPMRQQAVALASGGERPRIMTDQGR